jgi:hypothetical protein
MENCLLTLDVLGFLFFGWNTLSCVMYPESAKEHLHGSEQLFTISLYINGGATAIFVMNWFIILKLMS